MRPRRPTLVIGLAAITSIAATLPATAQCSSDPLWQTQSSITQVTSDTQFGSGLCFYALGPTGYATRAEPVSVPTPQAGGKIVWTFEFGGNIQNFPSPVPLSTGGVYLFVGGTDGKLYKINAQTGVLAGSIDAKRSGCSEDQVVAPPAVQLFNYSNPAFQTDMIAHRGFPDDLVLVVTKTGCGDHENNRVIAYYASNLTIKWQFNAGGQYKVDFGSDGCAIDYLNNLAVCGTNLDPAAVGQNSLWALNSVNGSLVWSANAGSIASRPMLSQNQLFVVSTDGRIHKLDALSGGPIWQFPIPYRSSAIRGSSFAVRARHGSSSPAPMDRFTPMRMVGSPRFHSSLH